MPVEFLVSAIVTLVVVVDPIGLVPIYLSVTHGLTPKLRRHVAFRASLIAAMILIAFALAGNWFLAQLAITLPAFRIAGGLLLFAVASEMVLGIRTERESKEAEQMLENHARNIAAFPLAIPLMAGPGAITATLLLSVRTAGDPVMLAWLIGVVVLVAAVCLVVFILAQPIERLLGTTGNIVLSRLLGILLAALAVQFVIDGVKEVL
jgi:multiple antibiotic resistance protein